MSRARSFASFGIDGSSNSLSYTQSARTFNQNVKNEYKIAEFRTHLFLGVIFFREATGSSEILFTNTLKHKKKLLRIIISNVICEER